MLHKNLLLNNSSVNTALFVSRKLFKRSKGSFSSIVSNVAIASIALGIAILISAYAVLNGFNSTIKEKIFGFSSHLEITRFGAEYAYGEVPLTTNTYLLRNASEIPEIKDIATVARKPALLKSEEGVQGVVLKGIGPEYNLNKTNDLLLEGRLIQPSGSSKNAAKEVLVSKILANKMRLKLGDDALLYFVQDPPRIRKLKIVGIYKSDIEEFDEKIIFGDIGLIQKLNGWGDTLVGGYEINVTDFNQLDTMAQKIYDEMDYDLTMVKVTDRYYQLFDWFRLLETNIVFLFVIVMVVVILNLLSSFTIIVMEKTNLIGTLKALGATNTFVQLVFAVRGLKMMFYGVLLGNMVGVLFCALQKHFQILGLDEKNYYMSYVPIEIDWSAVLTVNMIILTAIVVALIIPTLFITLISPIKSIRFD